MMVFIGYEPGSKAWRFYDPMVRHLHISHVAVFEEDRAWDSSKDEAGDVDSFRMEYVIARGMSPVAGNVAWPDPPLVTPAANSPTRS
jgi:hypothetical protein